MAQKVSVTFACDYDSKVITEGGHLTRAFGLDGRDYEIDLCARHGGKLDETIGRYAQHARRASARAQPVKRRTAAHRQHSANVRAWAKTQGIDVGDRGRIPADVVARYEAAHR